MGSGCQWSGVAIRTTSISLSSNTLAKIFIGLGLAARRRQPLIQVGLIDVAHGRDFHTVLHEVLHVVRALPARADNSQPDAVVRAQNIAWC